MDRSAKSDGPVETFESPTINEVLNGPRLILGPFPSDWFKSRDEISTLIFRPEGFTGALFKVDLKKVRQGDKEALEYAESVLTHFNGPYKQRFEVKMSEYEKIILLLQMKELLTSINEGKRAGEAETLAKAED